MKLHVIIFFSFLLLASCQKPIKEVVIDNPLDREIEVKFNQTEMISIPAGGSKKIDLQFGKENLSVKHGEQYEIYLDPDHNYLINPTLSTYYIKNEVYVFSQSGADNYKRDYGDIKTTIGGIVFEGDYMKVNPDVLIKKRWAFGVDETPSNQLQTKRALAKGYTMVKKLYRKSYFQLSSDALLELLEQ